MKELTVEQMEEINGGLSGSAVMSCIQDAYSNHGWISVALFLETAFIPWTAAVIAADCTLHNL
ncbi:hypothetical protein ABRY23_04570 [Melioribacteraceae bacterium 4301-Me]|uniref:hypothetical protein n=1 Tax=Pyranulibacter aquaticus TaxID=3163344 RepID=UPI00359BF0DC